MKFNVEYYSRGNFGDDLFLVILGKQFPDTKFNVIANPFYFGKIKDLPANVKSKCVLSFIVTMADYLLGRFRIRAFEHVSSYIRKIIYNSTTPYIKIGGSIFMETASDATATQIIQNDNLSLDMEEKIKSYCGGGRYSSTVFDWR